MREPRSDMKAGEGSCGGRLELAGPYFGPFGASGLWIEATETGAGIEVGPRIREGASFSEA